jgi:non-specific serine/threonine protein kinase
LVVAEEVGDDWLIAWAVHLLGLAAHIAADYPVARAYYARSLAIRRELGYQEGVGVVLALLGAVALREGELGQARALYREALAVMRAVFGPWGLAPLLAGFSRLAAAQGQSIRAVRLGAFAAGLSEAYHMPLIPLIEALATEGLVMAGQALGPAAYAAAWVEGRALALADAVAEALAVEAAPAVGAPLRATESGEHGPITGLTATEVRVLRLLAEGHTTKEIAAELAVAVSTVDRHITHIYQKLGVRNRAEATVVALRHGVV